MSVVIAAAMADHADQIPLGIPASGAEIKLHDRHSVKQPIARKSSDEFRAQLPQPQRPAVGGNASAKLADELRLFDAGADARIGERVDAREHGAFKKRNRCSRLQVRRGRNFGPR